MSIQIAVRLEDEVVAGVDRLIAAQGGTRSEFVREAIERLLYWKRCEEDAARYDAQPLTDVELALADDADVWSTAPEW